jgi:LPXTG-motif cell wall-anchored protein
MTFTTQEVGERLPQAFQTERACRDSGGTWVAAAAGRTQGCWASSDLGQLASSLGGTTTGGTAPAPAAPSSPGDWTAQNTTSVIGTGVQALPGGLGLGLQADAASQQRRFQQAQLEMQQQLAQQDLQFRQAQLAAAAAPPGSAEATQATAAAQQLAQQMVLVQQQMAAAAAARNAAATGPSAGTIALVAGGVAVAGLLLLVVTRRNDPAPGARYNGRRSR